MMDGDEQREREQILGSDSYSPGVKLAMQRFWQALDARREREKSERTGDKINQSQKQEIGK